MTNTDTGGRRIALGAAERVLLASCLAMPPVARRGNLRRIALPALGVTSLILHRGLHLPPAVVRLLRLPVRSLLPLRRRVRRLALLVRRK